MTLLLALVFCALAASTGFCVLRLLGLARWTLVIGLTPALGLAVLAILATWAVQLGAPRAVLGAAVAGPALVGVLLLTRDWHLVRTSWDSAERRAALLLVGAAVAVAAVVLAGTPFAQFGIPNYSHDGAHHVELIQAIRSADPGMGWYPMGFHASVAGLLVLMPWADSAQGAVGAGVGLSLLALPSLFGLGCGVLQSSRRAAAGALLAAGTLSFPYSPHYVSTWPMLAGLVLALGLWTTAEAYLAAPRAAWVFLGATIAAGIVLVHGTEVFTASLGLVVLLAASWKRVAWTRLAWHLPVALGVALALAGPYLPTLFGWAGGGGAVSFGMTFYESSQLRVARNSLSDELLAWLDTVGTGLLVDGPVRVALLCIGGVWALRERRGRRLVALLLVFVALALAFRYWSSPLMRQLYALTIPWGDPFRVLTLPSMVASLVAGAGLVSLVRAWSRFRVRVEAGPGGRHPRPWRLLRRAGGLSAACAATLLLFGFSRLLPASSRLYFTYSAQDEFVLGRLRSEATPGEVLANDGAADAGIWAPYKAGVQILAPRTTGPRGPSERLVLENVGRLEDAADARMAACALKVRYVFRGAAGHRDEPRRFPGLDVLRASTALEELASSGEAAVFRTRLDCGT